MATNVLYRISSGEVLKVSLTGQMFLPVDDESDYSFVLKNGELPFQIFGLVYDKVIGDYL